MTWPGKTAREAREKHFRRQEGRCWYCGCECILPTDRSGRLQNIPKNLATLEHLRDRHDPMRRYFDMEPEQRWRMACWECNGVQARNNQMALPIEAQWRRSRQWSKLYGIRKAVISCVVLCFHPRGMRAYLKGRLSS